MGDFRRFAAPSWVRGARSNLARVAITMMWQQCCWSGQISTRLRTEQWS